MWWEGVRGRGRKVLGLRVHLVVDDLDVEDVVAPNEDLPQVPRALRIRVLVRPRQLKGTKEDQKTTPTRAQSSDREWGLLS